MTKQTKEIHIIEISQVIIERLGYINITPNNILTYSEVEVFSSAEIKKLYPKAILNQTDYADLILALFTQDTSDIAKLLTKFKENLNPSGLLMFAGLNINFVLQDIGDFLQSLGFINIVMDKEMLSDSDEVIYGHAWAPQPQKPVRIPLSQVMGKK